MSQNLGTWHVANSYGRFVKAGLAPPCPQGGELDEEVLRRLAEQVTTAVTRVCKQVRSDDSLALPQFYYTKSNVDGVQGALVHS